MIHQINWDFYSPILSQVSAAVKSEYQQKKIFILVNKYFSAFYPPPYVFSHFSFHQENLITSGV